MDMVWIGSTVVVPFNEIMCLVDYKEPSTKRIVAKAKEENCLYDFSAGKGKHTVCVLKNGSVFITMAELSSVLQTMEYKSKNGLDK